VSTHLTRSCDQIIQWISNAIKLFCWAPDRRLWGTEYLKFSENTIALCLGLWSYEWSNCFRKFFFGLLDWSFGWSSPKVWLLQVMSPGTRLHSIAILKLLSGFMWIIWICLYLTLWSKLFWFNTNKMHLCFSLIWIIFTLDLYQKYVKRYCQTPIPCQTWELTLW
jgi:hypothetical protein